MIKRMTALLLALLVTLTAAAWLTAPAQALTTTVRVGYCVSYPPYQYTDAGGAPAGFHIDLLKAIAEEADFLLEYTAFPSTVNALDALAEGTVDIVLGVPDRQFYSYSVHYSDVLSSANLCLLTSVEAAELYRSAKHHAFRLAVEHRLISYGYLGGISSGNILLAGNQHECLRLQQQGHAEMIVGLRDVLLWYLEQEERFDDYEIINNYIGAVDFTAATRENDRRLFSAVNAGIAHLRASGRYESIYDRWFTPESEINYQRLLNTVLIVVGIGGIFLLSYLIVNSRAKKQLIVQVAERTTELNDANRALSYRTAQLQTESDLHHLIIESSPAAMVLFDEDGRIEYINANARLLTGAAQAGVGDPVHTLPVFGEILRDADEALRSADWQVHTGSYSRRGERPAQQETARYRYSLHRAERYGGHFSVLLTAEDVTREVREQEAVFEKKKNETLNSLIAGIAHEIKNPLTAINASAAMIQSKGDNPKYREAFSTYIPQEIDRITRLINNLIDYAKPQRNRIERVSLCEVLHSVIELARISTTGVALELAPCDDRALCFIGDRDKIKQSLLNIVLNGMESAQKRTTSDGQRHSVRVEASAEARIITVTVTDDGVGMTEEERARCMEPFYTTKKAGTGIGLAVTRQYVEEVGGTIAFESVKDSYTRVTICLPQAEEEEQE